MISRIEIQRLKRSVKNFVYAYNHKLQPEKTDYERIVKYLPELMDDYTVPMNHETQKIDWALIDVSLFDTINKYYSYRELKNPDLIQSYLFLVSEVGELGDAIVQEMSTDWARNDPNKIRNIEDEIGDVFMMLCEVALNKKTGVILSMLSKMVSKGFKL